MNSLYSKGKDNLLSTINLLTDDIKIVFVDAADYTEDVSDTGDEFLSDIPAAARVATSNNLTGKDLSDGAFDSDDVVFSGVSGDEFEAYVMYKDTGTASTSPLILFVDGSAELPTTPNGGEITLAVDSNGHFSI